jgi:hypothetical protein
MEGQKLSDLMQGAVVAIAPSMRITPVLLASLLLFTASAGADLVTPQTSASRILIPVAGDAPGANGTYFRSDIQIVNLRNAPQRVQIYWLPQGSSGAAIAPRTVDLGALSGFFSDDFVDNILLQDGVGGIEVVGVTQEGQFDPDARLHATARIWTPRPDGAAGTMSQTFPALVMPGSTARSKTVFGLRRSADYRLNVGIINPAQTAHRFRVTVRIATATGGENLVYETELAARSIEQRLAGGTATGIAQVLIEDLTAGTATDWQGWASSIDNASGDAWSQMAFPTPAP